MRGDHAVADDGVGEFRDHAQRRTLFVSFATGRRPVPSGVGARRESEVAREASLTVIRRGGAPRVGCGIKGATKDASSAWGLLSMTEGENRCAFAAYGVGAGLAGGLEGLPYGGGVRWSGENVPGRGEPRPTRDIASVSTRDHARHVRGRGDRAPTPGHRVGVNTRPRPYPGHRVGANTRPRPSRSGAWGRRVRAPFRVPSRYGFGWSKCSSSIILSWGWMRVLRSGRPATSSRCMYSLSWRRKAAMVISTPASWLPSL